MLVRVPLVLFAAACSLVGCGSNTGISGTYYAPEYDYSEFYALTNGKTFQVIVSGNPFPNIPQEEMERRLLPVMQANHPQPELTFTYDAPAEEPHPDYQLVLVFDPADNLTAARVCASQIRHRPHQSGRFYVFGVYCRNDLALTQSTARMDASSPEDPRIGQLFSDLFLVLFNPFPPRRGHRPFPFMSH
jgi:hypothetical protein